MQTSDMQEQKNKRLLISLGVLCILTLGAFWFSRQEKNIAVDKTIFQVSDLSSIDRIALKTSEGMTELSFNGSRWKVNGQYDADRDMIKVLFATLKQAEPKRPVSRSLRDSLSSALKQFGTQVTLFRGGEKQGSFIAGGNAKKTQAYFQEENSGEIFVMGIPGYRVYVSGVFELNEGGWRDKTIFNFHWSNFQGLAMEYPARPRESFKVRLSDQNIFGVEGLLKTDTTRLANYMDFVFTLQADQIIYSKEYVDSLIAQAPEAVLTVTDIANRNYKLKVFPSETDMIPALIGDNQAVNIDRRRLAPLLKPKSFFAFQ